MASRTISRFGKGDAPRHPSAVAIACTAVLVMDILLLSTLPSHNRLLDAGYAHPRGRLRGREAMAPAAAVRPQRDVVMGLSADCEALALYQDMVRFWGLDIEIGKVGRVSFAEDIPFSAVHAGLVQDMAAFSPGKNKSVLDLRPFAP